MTHMPSVESAINSILIAGQWAIHSTEIIKPGLFRTLPINHLTWVLEKSTFASQTPMLHALKLQTEYSGLIDNDLWLFLFLIPILLHSILLLSALFFICFILRNYPR